MRLNRPLAATACGLGAICVVLGAFAAHGAGPQVKPLLTTGAHYGMVHALLALFAAAWAGTPPVRWAGWLAVIGGAVFAASLALVGMAGLRAMGAVAPVGGLLMILSWLLFAWGVVRTAPPPSDLS